MRRRTLEVPVPRGDLGNTHRTPSPCRPDPQPVARTRRQLSCSRWLRQSCGAHLPASNRGVHNPVEILCRHADRPVRKLRIRVGTRHNDRRPQPPLPASMPSTGCARKIFPATTPSTFPVKLSTSNGPPYAIRPARHGYCQWRFAEPTAGAWCTGDESRRDRMGGSSHAVRAHHSGARDQRHGPRRDLWRPRRPAQLRWPFAAGGTGHDHGPGTLLSRTCVRPWGSAWR